MPDHRCCVTPAPFTDPGAQATWTFADGRLTLGDDGAPATLEAAEDGLLRMSGEEGSVVLRRDVLR